MYEYYIWLLERVGVDPDRFNNYREMFDHLNSVPFYWSVDNDVNRYRDAINLRYDFCDQMGCSSDTVDRYFPKDCSVLEVLAALAIRCENDVMHDSDLGDRTYIWFSLMLSNLGLNECDSMNYNEDNVDYILNQFLNREYDRLGNGSIFVTKNYENDMRKLELWYQMHVYLTENYEF